RVFPRSCRKVRRKYPEMLGKSPLRLAAARPTSSRLPRLRSRRPRALRRDLRRRHADRLAHHLLVVLVRLAAPRREPGLARDLLRLLPRPRGVFEGALLGRHLRAPTALAPRCLMLLALQLAAQPGELLAGVLARVATCDGALGILDRLAQRHQ